MNKESPLSSPSPELEARIVALLLGEASDFEREELNRLLEEREDLRQFKNQIQRVHKLLRYAAGEEPLAEDHPTADENTKDNWKLNAEKRTAMLAALGGDTTTSTSDASIFPSTSQAVSNPKIVTPLRSVSPQHSPDSAWPMSIDWWIPKTKYVVAACLAAIVLVVISATTLMDPRQLATTVESRNSIESTDDYQNSMHFYQQSEFQAESGIAMYGKEEEESLGTETEMDGDGMGGGGMDRMGMGGGGMGGGGMGGGGMGGMGGMEDMGGGYMGGMEIDMVEEDLEIQFMDANAVNDIYDATDALAEGKSGRKQGQITGDSDSEGSLPQDAIRSSRNPSSTPPAAAKSTAMLPFEGRTSGSKPTSGLANGTIDFPTGDDESSIGNFSRTRGRLLDARKQSSVAGTVIGGSTDEGKSNATPPVVLSINTPQQPAAKEWFADGPAGAGGRSGFSREEFNGGYALSEDTTDIRVDGTPIKGRPADAQVSDMLDILAKDGAGKKEGKSILDNLELNEDPITRAAISDGEFGDDGNKNEEPRAEAEVFRQKSGQQQAQAGKSFSQSGRARTADSNGRASARTLEQSPSSPNATAATMGSPTPAPKAGVFDSGLLQSAPAESSSIRSTETSRLGKESLALGLSEKLKGERLSEATVDQLGSAEVLNREQPGRPQPSVAGPVPGVNNSLLGRQKNLEMDSDKKAKSDATFESHSSKFKDKISDHAYSFGNPSTLKADLAANGIVDINKSLSMNSRSSQLDLGVIENQISSREQVLRAERITAKREILSKKPAEKNSEVPTGLTELDAEANAFSTFSLHVSDVSFKLAHAALSKSEWPQTGQIRVEEFVNAFDYGDPMPTQEEKVACRVEQAIHPFLQQRNLMRVSMRTAAAGRASNTPLRLTFLLDNSGSMERIDRQQTVRRAFTVLAQQLKPIDEVTLISFARQPRLLADRVSGGQAANLLKMIDELPSEGGTNLEAALQLAFEKALEQQQDNAQNRVILLTDGAVNLGDASPERLSNMIVNMRNSGIAFDAAGISADGLNDEILEALTRKGDGRYYLLDSLETVDDGFAKQIAGALRPAAKNVKIQIEFNPKRVGKYKLLGFEKHRLNKEDFRNDKVDAAEMTAAEAGVAVYQFEAKPDGHGDIGTVSIRFRDLATGEMVEELWPIPYEASARTHDMASPSMKIAAAASLLATKLKGGALSDTVDMKVLANLVAGLPQQQRNNRRVQMLQAMIQQARQLGGN